MTRSRRSLGALALAFALAGCHWLEPQPAQAPQPATVPVGRWAIVNGTDTDGIARTYLLDTVAGDVFRLGKMLDKEGKSQGDLWWEMDRLQTIEGPKGASAGAATEETMTAEERKLLEDLGVPGKVN